LLWPRSAGPVDTSERQNGNATLIIAAADVDRPPTRRFANDAGQLEAHPSYDERDGRTPASRNSVDDAPLTTAARRLRSVAPLAIPPAPQAREEAQ